MKLSAGLLPFRYPAPKDSSEALEEGGIEVLVVHPGGPFWAGKDDHAWSIAKGEHGADEDPLGAAEREFTEELGIPPPSGPRIDLGALGQPSGKRIQAWAIEAPFFSVEQLASDTFTAEWPPRSGRFQVFPEVDRADWLVLEVARVKLVVGQVPFLDRLLDRLRARRRAGQPLRT